MQDYDLPTKQPFLGLSFRSRSERKKVKNSDLIMVYIKICVKGVVCTISTGTRCLYDNWDSTKAIGEGQKEINQALAKVKTKIINIYNALVEFAPKQITARRIADIYLGRTTIVNPNKEVAIISILNTRLELNKSNGKIGEQVYLRSQTIIEYLKKFFVSIGNENLSYREFEYSFYGGFLKWLKANTGSKKNGYLKKFTQTISVGNEFALRNGYTKTLLSRYESFNDDATKTEYFTKAEFDRFLAVDTSANDQLDYVKDMFLLMCYTGFSTCDLRAFDTEKHIQTDAKGNEWIIKKREKTGTEQIVPLFPEAKAIIDKWGRLDQYCELTHNRDIKVLAKLAGINKKISVRCGRKTCGMWLINQKISIEVVSRILGHKNINITQKHYASILIDRIDDETIHLRGKIVPETVSNALNMQNMMFEMMQKQNALLEKLTNKE